MLEGVKFFFHRRRIESSLKRDPMQGNDWVPWLDTSASMEQLRASCPYPGWLVHCAYWAEIPQDRLVDATLVMAELAIRRGPKHVFPDLTALDLRSRSLPDLAELVLKIEKKHTAIRRIEQALPQQANPSLLLLENARGTEDRGAPFDLGRGGAAGAAAGGFVLALITLFHHFHNLRESLTFTSAGAASLFAIAMPNEREALLEVLRAEYGWPLVKPAADAAR